MSFLRFAEIVLKSLIVCRKKEARPINPLISLIEVGAG